MGGWVLGEWVSGWVLGEWVSGWVSGWVLGEWVSGWVNGWAAVPSAQPRRGAAKCVDEHAADAATCYSHAVPCLPHAVPCPPSQPARSCWQPCPMQITCKTAAHMALPCPASTCADHAGSHAAGQAPASAQPVRGCTGALCGHKAAISQLLRAHRRCLARHSTAALKSAAQSTAGTASTLHLCSKMPGPRDRCTH